MNFREGMRKLLKKNKKERDWFATSLISFKKSDVKVVYNFFLL